MPPATYCPSFMRVTRYTLGTPSPFMCRAVMADLLRAATELGLGRIASSWPASLQPLNLRPFILRSGAGNP
jgi:hypothetical protein